MSGKTYKGGISTSAIKWDKDETEATQDEIAFVTIKCVGWLASDIALGAALSLVPALMPTGSDGPCGADTQLANAELQNRKAKFEDSMIRLDCTYKKTVALVTQGPGGTPTEEQSDSDKTGLRINTVEEPLLTHPVAMKFPRRQLNLLGALIQGSIRTNFEVDEESASYDFEFVSFNPDTSKWSKEVIFDATPYTAHGITASPLDYARCLKAGINTYKRAATTHVWETTRDRATPASELNSVGTIVNPPKAPSVTDREWFYDGLNETQFTPKMFSQSREFLLSEDGGALKQIYKHGSADINANPES